jgi:cAMP-dependent protein kinase regulator
MVKNYSPGEAFGELALLYNAKRAASIKAKTQSVLWALDRETFNHIVKESAIKKRNKYENFLKSVLIFNELDPYELSLVADALQLAYYKKSECVIKEGEFGDVFYIIEEGTATATKSIDGKKPAPVKNYKKGDYFGELALIKNQPRAANVIADVYIINIV